MERLPHADLAALLEAARAAYDLPHLRRVSLGPDAFPRHGLAVLSALVPCEIQGYTEVDRAARRVRRVGEPAEPAAEIETLLGRHQGEHPLLRYYGHATDTRPMKFSDFLSRHQLHRLGLYNELYRRFHIEYQIGVLLANQPAAIAGWALSRNRRDFTERERLLLTLVQPHLLQAARNAEALARLAGRADRLHRGLRTLGAALLTAAADGRIRDMEEGALDTLEAYFGGTNRPVDRLPEPLRRWLAHQVRLLGRPGRVPPAREPFVAEREGARLVVRLLSTGADLLLLLEERRTVWSSRALAPLGLTVREAEVVAWVARGKSNAAVGAILGMAERTVQKHLERIHRKLGVESRTAAVARVFDLLDGSAETGSTGPDGSGNASG